MRPAILAHFGAVPDEIMKRSCAGDRPSIAATSSTNRIRLICGAAVGVLLDKMYLQWVKREELGLALFRITINQQVRCRQIFCEQTQWRSVGKVNNDQKYSLDPLEGDEWEVRRTKQVLRAVVRAKEKQALTTEQLASRCSDFMGQQGAVKRATLNGLFAGKRKSLSIAELTMLASALRKSMWDLIYPVGEEVEVSPGRFISSADALVNETFVSLPVTGQGNVALIPGRVAATIEVIQAAEVLTDHVMRAIAHARAGVGNTHHLSSAAYEAFELRTKVASYARDYGDAPTLSDAVRFVIDLQFNRNNVANGGPAARVFESQLLSIEHYFDGISIGGYRLGSSDGEPEAEG